MLASAALALAACVCVSVVVRWGMVCVCVLAGRHFSLGLSLLFCYLPLCGVTLCPIREARPIWHLPVFMGGGMGNGGGGWGGGSKKGGCPYGASTKPPPNLAFPSDVTHTVVQTASAPHLLIPASFIKRQFYWNLKHIYLYVCVFNFTFSVLFYSLLPLNTWDPATMKLGTMFRMNLVENLTSSVAGKISDKS